MSTETTTQTDRVFNRCGGAPKVAEMLGYNRSSVYKWNYPKSKGGTGGYIPSSVLERLIKVARREGILITGKDLYPELIT